jgi:predicted ArsR family transcriptional regulator
MPGERHWKEDLVELVDRDKEFTTEDAAEELDLTYAAAANLLKRLQGWGLLRVAGFDDPVHAAKRNPGRKGDRAGIGGRRRKVYEVTDAARRKVEWWEKQGKAATK